MLIEVSKNKIPESDVIYEAEKVKVSKIKNTELTVGSYKDPYYKGEKEPAGYSENYIAEFISGNVGYRIKSENISQEEFIKILLSMPCFQ